MARSLTISIGQHSDTGVKEANQDFHGAVIPAQPALGLKGVAVALADGISSSAVSRVASETAVKSFLTDYYCTSDAWSVATSVHRVLAASNSWLHAETRRSRWAHDRDKGYVTTFSGLVLKSATAHLFHVGDSRIARVVGAALEQLTEDHRLVVSSEQSYLARALGMARDVEIDHTTLPLARGDVFVLTTDGVHDHVSAKFVIEAIAAHADDLDAAARAVVAEAMASGSGDNLTIQIVRIDELPDGDAGEAIGRAGELPPPPLLEARQVFEGYRIERQIHASSRSHIHLATDLDDDRPVVIKIPSVDLRGDPAYLKRFMMEEWVARRIDSPHVLKPMPATRRRNFLYIVTEHVDGQTLAQWMIDNPTPSLEVVRGIVEQIAKGLRAFHRKEMLHQDLRPANIMIDRSGTVKIIDFGSTRVAGVIEAAPDLDATEILGTAQYTAPEYYLGEGGSTRSDLYSLGVIAYHMLTGRLPYGTRVAGARTRAAQRRLAYASALDDDRAIPAWVDEVLKRAVAVDPAKRYEALSEFTHELRQPTTRNPATGSRPLAERNPLRFWQVVALSLLVANLLQLILKLRGR
ncbi:bifunctional protein-serine/threonine kinase/phosphatase [Pinisolibacter aquiterrae]|jgi:serine/threonine protein phosphatase PrpC|uniref:bifunctional protein-serine/threonine kinase/phosphatase n=1 Tax=Pinisolibacter aquiterrae TaxID=2815579 RepID=UPI001C3C6A48|nr:bifunctional protein-serine/threonine kinase/phosphatase [Pinisolibacter aquiterrae]MBV5264261.1 protein kinase [Pinisolibacter aquiterrae]MCC8236154.1 bifunctional serine/threonine-protein phosphatase/kinase [Pinisolibacter aquiterrae]